ncbi:DNA cytosine methyltransferase [Streptomyces sp. NPDC095614]|uniref:DNA cytosine methyltransferase n=1 Tax=Streptomyces sp. NPDC095614 TaxID=3156692 RepID=UPI003331423E
MKRLIMREDVTEELSEQDDERTGLVLEPLRWALAAVDSGHPYEAVLLAQAPTVLPIWQAMAEALRNEGYSVAFGILRAEEFGVPQTRRRAVLIARRQGIATLPRTTHQPYGKSAVNQSNPLPPYVSMSEVLNRPRPFNLISNYGSGGDPKSRGRRTSTEPAFSVTAKFTRCKVATADGTELERLTCAEAGRLQSFPADYPWAGVNQAQQIANATPPLLATHIVGAALL